MRLIDADAFDKCLEDAEDEAIHMQKYVFASASNTIRGNLRAFPTIEPERKKDIIQKFHDYQVEWLKSHYDIELERQLEEMIIRFLHDTANCYMMEIDREEGGQDETN